MTLGKSLKLSEPQLPPHLNGDNHNYLTALLKVEKDKVYIKYFAQCLVRNRGSEDKF